MSFSQDFIVHGRVQGVGFRASTQREAKRLRLTGWVRNDAEGFVEIQACGDRDALQALHAWLQQGPSAARVTEVQDGLQANAQPSQQGFEIR